MCLCATKCQKAGGGGIAPFGGVLTSLKQVSRDMGYRSDSITISRYVATNRDPKIHPKSQNTKKTKRVYTNVFEKSSRELLPSSMWHESGTQRKLFRKACSDELFYLGWILFGWRFLLWTNWQCRNLMYHNKGVVYKLHAGWFINHTPVEFINQGHFIKFEGLLCGNATEKGKA